MVVFNCIPKKRHPYTLDLSGFKSCECNGSGDSSSGMTDEERKMLDELYNEIFKTTMNVSGGGSFVNPSSNTVTVSWDIRKKGQRVTPDSITINGETVDRNSTSKTYTGVSTPTTWTVVAIVGSQTLRGSVNASFYNTYQIFYGNGKFASQSDVTAAVIEALRSDNPARNKNRDYTNITLNDEQFIIAYPASLGTSTIKDENNFGMDASFTTGTVNVRVTKGSLAGQTVSYRYYYLTDPTTNTGVVFKIQ